MSLTDYYDLPDHEQEEWLADWELTQKAKAETCPICGNPISECGNAENPWYPQRHVDYAEMSLAYANWLYDQMHEDAPFHDGTFESWSKTRSSAHPFHFRDGVRLWVAATDLKPDDDWLRDQNPLNPSADDAAASSDQM